MEQELDSSFFPEVVQAIPTNNFGFFAYFNDGSIHFYDMKPLIQKGTVFEKLADLSFYKSHITVMNNTVAWDMTEDRNPRTCIDLDPCVIFTTPRVQDPLLGFGEGSALPELIA